MAVVALVATLHSTGCVYHLYTENRPAAKPDTEEAKRRESRRRWAAGLGAAELAVGALLLWAAADSSSSTPSSGDGSDESILGDVFEPDGSGLLFAGGWVLLAGGIGDLGLSGIDRARDPAPTDDRSLLVDGRIGGTVAAGFDPTASHYETSMDLGASHWVSRRWRLRYSGSLEYGHATQEAPAGNETADYFTVSPAIAIEVDLGTRRPARRYPAFGLFAFASPRVVLPVANDLGWGWRLGMGADNGFLITYVSVSKLTDFDDHPLYEIGFAWNAEVD